MLLLKKVWALLLATAVCFGLTIGAFAENVDADTIEANENLSSESSVSSLPEDNEVKVDNELSSESSNEAVPSVENALDRPEEPFSEETNYLSLFIHNVHGVSISIDETVIMKNLTGDDQYLYLSFHADDGNGYAVMDLEDWTIIEMSLDSLPLYSVTGDMLYAGPLSFISLQDGVAYDSNTNQPIDIEIKSNRASRFQSIDESTKQKMLSEANDLTRATRETISGSGSTTWAYSSGNVYGDCGVNAMAMLEKWYDTYVNTNYLPSNLSTESTIKNSIKSYIEGTGEPWQLSETRIAAAITAHTKKVGLNGYYLYGTTQTYSWSSICSRVTSNKPTLISIKGEPTYGYHYVIVTGFSDTGTPSTNQFYVNNGWGGYAWINQSYTYRQIVVS